MEFGREQDGKEGQQDNPYRDYFQGAHAPMTGTLRPVTPAGETGLFPPAHPLIRIGLKCRCSEAYAGNTPGKPTAQPTRHKAQADTAMLSGGNQSG